MSFAPKTGFSTEPDDSRHSVSSDDSTSIRSDISRAILGTGASLAADKNEDQLLSELAVLISDGSINFQRVLTRTANLLIDFFGASGIAIALEDDRGRISCLASAGETAPEVGTELNAASGISGLCLRTGEPQCCHDAKTDGRVDAESCQAMGILSILIAPVLLEQRTVGLVELFSGEDFFFDNVDAALLKSVAGLMAQAKQRSLGAASVAEPRTTLRPQAVPTPVQEIRIVPPMASIAQASSAPAPAKPEVATTVATTPLFSPSPASSATATQPAPAAKKTTTTISRAPAAQTSPDLRNRIAKIAMVVAGVALLGVGGWAGAQQVIRYRAARFSLPTTAAAAMPAGSANSVKPTSTSTLPALVDAAATSTPKTDDKKPSATTNLPTQKPAPEKKAPKVLDLLPTDEQPVATAKTKPAPEEAPAVPAQLKLPAGSALVTIATAMSPSRTPVQPNLRTLSIEPEVLIHKVQPEYPLAAKQMRAEGKVDVLVTIGKDGSIHDARIENGNQIFAGSVLSAIKQWKYKPYRVDGEPREHQILVSVTFHR